MCLVKKYKVFAQNGTGKMHGYFWYFWYLATEAEYQKYPCIYPVPLKKDFKMERKNQPFLETPSGDIF